MYFPKIRRWGKKKINLRNNSKKWKHRDSPAMQLREIRNHVTLSQVEWLGGVHWLSKSSEQTSQPTPDLRGGSNHYKNSIPQDRLPKRRFHFLTHLKPFSQKHIQE
ncbi:hypothetical protein CEXT_228021 [Caerostris extrusa]|uniref:Uncharacterized protein n=1 Tax=Caerostris extrusa TaxID=172846 RepID=A0AAV4NP18_CAEEX|nr:hypothetical protein CEXT_228021 [Caerostris extrusa]